MAASVPNSRLRRPKHKTCERVNAPGHAHALTFCCLGRRPFLSRKRTRQWVIEAIEQARHKHAFDLWAYVIMPEHVHLPPYLRNDRYSVSRILSTLKQPVAKRAILFVKHEAPGFLPWITDRQPNGKEALRFWQRGGGFDRNLWTPRHVWSTIDHIHANPVRRALCALDTDWPWSSAKSYRGVDGSPLSVDFDSLLDDPRPVQLRGGCS